MAEPDVTVAELVAGVLAAGRTRLVEHAATIGAGGEEEEEDVHQARVATRQLRALLRSFRAVLDRSWVRRVRAELAWLGDTLGSVRDADVLTRRLSSAIDELGDREGCGDAVRAGEPVLLGRLAEQRRGAAAVLAGALNAPRYRALVGELAVEEPPVVCPAGEIARELVPTWVHAAWGQVYATVTAYEEEPNDHALHQVRIAAKRLRYLCESAAPVIGKPASRLGKSAARLQEVLGELQDAVVAAAWLEKALATAGSEPAAALAHLLLAREQEIQQDRRHEWQPRWQRLRDQYHEHWSPG